MKRTDFGLVSSEYEHRMLARLNRQVKAKPKIKLKRRYTVNWRKLKK